MIKSRYSDANSRSADAEWSLLAIAHPARRVSRTANGTTGNYDPRPLWQRLDDEEDQQLMKQRRLTRYVWLSVFAAASSVLFIWLVS